MMGVTVIDVAGCDSCKGGWIAVVLRGGLFHECAIYRGMKQLVDAHPSAAVVAVDIPIGLPETGYRRADVEARRFLGPRRHSVFLAPARSVLEEPTYRDALTAARRSGGPGVSSQTFALAGKIVEVDTVARECDRIVEVHPEVCFRAMAGRPLEFPKRSWNGLFMRRRLLREHGIVVPERLETAGVAAPDDVVDAAAAAWTAKRLATGDARSLPDPPERMRDGSRAAIWY
jgi:predicted RNase H-like nuclease